MVETSELPKPLPKAAVHKFGGSSLKDAAAIAAVVDTIRRHVRPQDVVVVSANGGVTDQLLDLLAQPTASLQPIESYMTQLFKAVLKDPDELLVTLTDDFDNLAGLLGDDDRNPHDVLAFGELWSARLLSAKLDESGIRNHWRDARGVLTVDGQNNLIHPVQALSRLQQTTGRGIQVLTGFLASDENGQGITLGRNGSDYSATLVAALLDAAVICLWTDVDGVYTADPRLVSQARRIPKLTLSEAHALAELGSHVLHPKTINPLLRKSVNMVINTCQATTPGTDVVDQPTVDSPAVTTLAHKGQLVGLCVSDIDELQVRRLQTQLTAGQISHFASHFDKTCQALSLYVAHEDWLRAAQLIRQAGLTISEQVPGISLISAVGHNIRQNHRVIGQLLNRTARFDVLNIHYPTNDHTLCVLLKDELAPALLADLHATCFELEPSIPIVVLGYGNIGRQFIHILKANKAAIEQRVNQSLSLVAVANSRHYQFAEDCLLTAAIDPDQPNDQGQVFARLKPFHNQPLVLIDLTASEQVADRYTTFATQGWHLISANKRVAADHQQATLVAKELARHHRKWLINTTVGAALPIQDSIRKLQESGDRIHAVSGVFSGSLSWLFGQFDGQQAFMELVRQAHDQAYTEPDPRDDLSGQDVYRKALILARLLGFTDVQVAFEPVIPERFLSGSLEDFWAQATDINDYLQSMWQQAQDQQQRLCYLATVGADGIRVAPQFIASDHPVAAIQPGDNIFIIDTEWYAANPLVIQGPGAGREVTAAGVLNDLIEVLQSD
jgi:aspartokinase/homoserine dehydrogenase 2